MTYMYSVHKFSRFYLKMHLRSTFPCITMKSETYVQFFSLWIE